MRSPLRVGFIGAGSIVPTHMQALDSLGRAEIVAICSRSAEHARATVDGRATAVYTEPDAMLRREKLDAAFVCVPPYAAAAACQLLASEDVPFLVEKPVAALDSTVACQVADEVEKRRLVAAVGYQLRGLDFLGVVREKIHVRPPEMVVARWMDRTPVSEWWSRPELSGGQVIEQMTHFYDLARTLLGDATVEAATTTRAGGDSSDVVGSASAIVRFKSGAVGVFVNTRHAVQPVIEFELVAVATIRLAAGPAGWMLTLADDPAKGLVRTCRSPYEVQAEAFLDAVAAQEPARVLASYRDGLDTYLLTRSVVAAGGRA